MFPIQGRYGLATYGSGFVNNRSIYNHIIELADRFPAITDDEDHLEKMTGFIVDYFKDQLLAEWKKPVLMLICSRTTGGLSGFSFADSQKIQTATPFPTLI